MSRPCEVPGLLLMCGRLSFPFPICTATSSSTHRSASFKQQLVDRRALVNTVVGFRDDPRQAFGQSHNHTKFLHIICLPSLQPAHQQLAWNDVPKSSITHVRT